MQFRELIKKILPKSFINFVRRAVYPEKIYLIEDKLDSLFKTYYQPVTAPDLTQKTALRNAEFKIYSKIGEDGLILQNCY